MVLIETKGHSITKPTLGLQDLIFGEAIDIGVDTRSLIAQLININCAPIPRMGAV